MNDNSFFIDRDIGGIGLGPAPCVEILNASLPGTHRPVSVAAKDSGGSSDVSVQACSRSDLVRQPQPRLIEALEKSHKPFVAERQLLQL
jgi:hypothetical protein